MDSPTCASCGSTGRCAHCAGVGSFPSGNKKHPEQRLPCRKCFSSGRCMKCGSTPDFSEKLAEIAKVGDCFLVSVHDPVGPI